jgi:uncharacterized protein (TIGR03000 family)
VIRRIAGALGALTVLVAPVAAPLRAEPNSNHHNNNRATISTSVPLPSGLRGGFFYPLYGGFFPGYVSVYYGGPSYYTNINVGTGYAAEQPANAKIEDIPAPKPNPANPKIEEIPAPKPALENPPAAAAPSAPVAEIDLTVPADADVWFQGIKVKQTGTVRFLVTPPLKSGRSYNYEVRATYSENGREVTTVRNLCVHAGDRLQALLIALPVASSSSTTVSSGQ